MRTRTRMFFLLALIALAAGLLPALATQTPTSIAQTQPDDEIAYVNSASRIQIVDPHTASGQAPFTWTSTTTGWTDFAVLDANADGVDELVAIGGNKTEILVPHPASTTPPSFARTIGTSFRYTLVAAGDIIPGDGGRDEILVQRTDNREGSTHSIQIYNGNVNGTAWSLVYDGTFGSEWLSIEMGDVDGLEGDEVVMMRASDKRIKIMKYAPNGTFPTIFEDRFSKTWLSLAVGNSHLQNNGGIEEIITTRSGVHGTLPSLLVFQYQANQLHDAPNGEGFYFPYWEKTAVGDVNASGDDEVFLIRDPNQSSGISLIGLNWGTDTLPSVWTDPGIQLGRDLRGIATGDTDADGKAEVIVAQPGWYRIYTAPEQGVGHSGNKTASFRSPLIMHLGNFDGSGVDVEPGQLSVNPTSMDFEMDRDGENPPSKTFQVTNIGGGGAIAYNVTRVIDGNWLQITPFDGATPGTHTVSIDGTGLTPGNYDGVILVTATDPEVEDSPRQIQVRLVVNALGPELAVSPPDIGFRMNFGGLLPFPVDLAIDNVGDGGRQNYSLEITTDDGEDWIVAEKTSGQTNDVVEISVDPSSLSSGIYSGNIVVDAGDIENSPISVPISLTIEATGMEVTPTRGRLVVDVDQPSPVFNINIDQAAEGTNAIHWYAYAVPSGDWWSLQPEFEAGELAVEQTDRGYTFTALNGASRELSYLPWINLTPNNGFTPGVLQASLDMDTAPVGNHRVTILVDGGPGTPNRFQGVDMQIKVSDGGAWLPLILNP